MQMKYKILFGLVGCSVTVGIGVSVTQKCYSNSTVDRYADSQYAKLMAIDPFGGNMVADKAAYWTLEPWTSDDAVYAKARQDIETNNIPPRKLEAQYESTATAEPKSPVAQFRWGYALKKNLDDAPLSSEAGAKASSVFYSLTQVKDPHTYNYSRLRYLVSIRSRDLVRLGERLLKEDPKDHPVKLHLVEDYAFDVGKYGNPVSKTRALAICHQLLQEDPKNPRYYAVLGVVYEMSYYYRHNPSDGALAIAADRKYISRSDSQSDHAQMITKVIAEIQTDLVKDKQSVIHPK